MSMLGGIVTQAKAYTWNPLVSVSRKTVLTLLSRISTGQLVIKEVSTNITTVCGLLEPRRQDDIDLKHPPKGPEPPSCELRVNSDVFWVRLLLFADMGFAESYMLGEIDCEDLVAFFEIFILNRSALSNATTMFSSVASAVSSIARKTNTLANARLNISAHYDISNAMFAAFLSPDMTYSCAIFPPISSPEAQIESLEDAQMRKLRYFIDEAHIDRDDHVLEIGTGWGSFAIEAVRLRGCRVTSLTLSVEQKALAEERIAAAGMSDKIKVLLCDYRALEPENCFDKIISIEMLEAVGAEFLKIYFECVSRYLKPEGGIAVFQCITIPETRYKVYATGNDFIRKYIFPGGHLPTVSQLIRSIDEGSGGTLIVHGIRDIGGHYSKTLRLWREEFASNFETRIRPAFLQEHKNMSEEDIDVFKRKWEYYFTYCEAGFRTKSLGDVIITVGREGATQLIENIPL